jgi:uncharacterized membrane protein
MNFYLPILLVIASEVLYHTSSKATPDSINPLASIAMSYIVGMVLALVFYFITSPVKSLAVEYRHLNWAAFTLGISVVLMELGYILVYKAGWDINIASLICNASLAMILIVLGAIFYKESLSVRQLLGVLLCLTGLVLIVYKRA